MNIKDVRAKLNSINKIVDEHLDFLLEIRQDEELYKDDINEIGKMADEVLETLRSHHDLLHEPSGGEKDWVCEKCGKSTFETDYDYLVHPTLHLGCALEDEGRMDSFAEELKNTDTGNQPS
tara:strand:+ start:336 stop:698 length:363 start_codon:yes stop_codon:yes gene_type:complete